SLELGDTNLTGDGWVHVTVNSSSDPTGDVINLTEVKRSGNGIGIFQGSVKVVTTTPGPGEVRVTGDEPVTAHYSDKYPKRTLSVPVMAYIPVTISSVVQDTGGRTLTYMDKVTVTINGTKGWDACFDVVGIGSRQGIDANDDGISPDSLSGDGTYTGEFTVPNLLVGNFTIRGHIQRSYLPPVSRDSLTKVCINTNIPRKPINLSAEPVLTGNTIGLTWGSTGDMNLMSYLVFRANESSPGSGIPGEFSLVHATPDNRTFYDDTGLVDGKLYFYQLRSFNILGHRSEPSEQVSSIPRDETPPWFSIESGGSDLFLRGEYEINYTVEDDAVLLIFQGAMDNNNDGSPDSSWVEIGSDTTPSDPFIWDTTELLSPLVEGKRILVSVSVSDEVGNVNLTGTMLFVHIDNTPPDHFTIYSDLISAINISVYRLAGETEPRATIVVMKEGSEFIRGTSDEDGDFELFLSLAQSENLFEVLCFDELGNGPRMLDDPIMVVYDPYDPIAGISVTDATTSAPFALDGSPSIFVGPDTSLSGLVNFTWTVDTPRGEVTLYGKVVDQMISIPGYYTVTLNVMDSAMNHDITSIEILIADTDPPVISDMDDILVNEDEEIVLSSPYIFDNDPRINEFGILTWNLTGPDNRLFTGNDIEWSFNTPGHYLCILTITDTGGGSDHTMFNITVTDITIPRAVAGEDVQVIRGSSVPLSASLSTDNDPEFPDGANFTWMIKDENIILYGAEVNLTLGTLGDHRVLLKVSDGSLNVELDELIVTVITDGSAPEVSFANFIFDPLNLTPGMDLVMVFNEDIDPLTIYSNFHIVGPSGMDLPVVVTLLDPRTVSLDPVEDIVPGWSYTVIVSDGVTDLSGERVERKEFELMICPRLEIVSVDGATSFMERNGEMGMLKIPWIMDIRLSSDIGAGSDIYLLGDDGNRIEVEWTWNPEFLRVDLSLSSDIGPGSYTLCLDLVDEVGRDMFGTRTLSFKVEEDTEGPEGQGGGGRP
ncbi:MAG: Ig-like domain-containing protein, partial [Candidatus Thermoplasmatota archaeon]|nr:Ig-like domain-containing protein [Candidatus Thermoplasmatota archaeon]